MKKIFIVAPTANLGVRTALCQIFKGLKSENYCVDLLMLRDPTIPYLFFSDFTNAKRLEDCDIILYMGSIAWPSHMFVKSPRKALFIHGFIEIELINLIKYSTIRAKLGASTLLVYRKIFNSKPSMLDFFICHSITSREMNKVTDDCVIIPQFIVDKDVKFYDEFSRQHKIGESGDNTVRIITYTSLARSPRLLSKAHLISLVKKLSKLVKRKFEFYIIDPIGSLKSCEIFDLNYVKISRALPRFQYLSLLGSSNLYLESGLDEEVRYSFLEAGLLGTPVAKMTLPRFVQRQDYSEKDLLLATSIDKLATEIAEYVNNVEYYEPYFKKNIRNFILKKRVWNQVKNPLIEKLDEH